MGIDIFISVGRAARQAQEVFVVAVEEMLRVDGLNPRAVGRNDFSSKQPLKHVQELLQKCRGTVIIAFERLFVGEGEERRGSPDARPVRQEILPTVWNQIEAAMAYGLNHPLLVIVEEGSRNEGLLEAGYDWYVLNVKIDPASLHTTEFRGVYADWIRRVREHEDEIVQRERELPAGFDFGRMSLRDFVSRLTPGQIWKAAAALVSIAVASYSLGVFMARYLFK